MHFFYDYTFALNIICEEEEGIIGMRMKKKVLKSDPLMRESSLRIWNSISFYDYVFNTQYKCHSLTKGFKGVVYLQAFENEYNNGKQSFTTGSGV